MKSGSVAQIPWSTLVAGGIVLLLLGAVSLVVRAIVKGDLVPRTVLQDEKERADKWEAAWRESEARMDALDGRLTVYRFRSAQSASSSAGSYSCTGCAGMIVEMACL